MVAEALLGGAIRGAWPVFGRHRSHWGWTSFGEVGRLQLGISPDQVPATLGGEMPAGRRGRELWPVHTGAVVAEGGPVQRRRGERTLRVQAGPARPGSCQRPRGGPGVCSRATAGSAVSDPLSPCLP